ncbi:hypothetical protein C3941_08145 [Kaistia algarum]|uniref:FUSC family protein n=1 Tax=Kaistia algarum TaxID=2083279 RepID=UPI000CE78A80|nr:FUSC family protein [Kaistia algarum]MCX5512028.1 FUSC family protein [Kaistia algarum]PPE80153.1 hypothetical protein C3941_08145 [Kaistia algarum]
MTASPAPRTGEGGTAPASRIDWMLLERSLRFSITVMTPIAVTQAFGMQNWLVFAMVAGIVAFAGDAGGRPGARLLWMATGPLALCIGLLLGSISLAHPLFVIALSMTAGLFYGVVETSHPHLLLAARFFAFGIVLAGLVFPPAPIDYLAILVMLAYSWLVSLAFDLPRRSWQALTVPPFIAMWPGLALRSRERWAFGASVAIAVGLALATTHWTGATRPSWACLTILMVMRSEVASSLRLSVERVVGTLAGVIIAVLVAHNGSESVMLLVMALAAFVRWPAQQVHNALGVFCLTVFVLLMVELVTPDGSQADMLLHERFYDTLIGAVAAGFGLLAFPVLRRLFALAAPDDGARRNDDHDQGVA